VRSELVCLGDVLYEPGGTSGPRQQRDWQLVFLHSGELWAAVDDRRYRLVPGQVGLFAPGTTEMFELSKTHPSHHSWCSVSPLLVPGYLEPLLANAAAVQTCDKVQAGLLAAGMALGSAGSAVAQRVVDQIGLALLVAYAKAAENPDLSVVARAVSYMQEHLSEQDCLQKAHLAAGVSRNTLIRWFQVELGVAPARHLWRLRTERGIALLAETDSTIAEIAYACGFRDPFHFSRQVKSLQGASPSELRRKLWSKPPALD
jgi:AraC-like DNA-binding protein